MHSFRLRYVALGLLIYIQSAFSDTTCGSDGFVDVASSTVLSSTVFEGQVRKLASLTDGRVFVLFKVMTIYKGNLTGVGGNNNDSLLVLVGNFGPSEDRSRCVAPTKGLRVTSRTSYLVFLNRTGRPVQFVSVDEFEDAQFRNYYSKINNASSSVFYYSISGFPENATKQACQEARNYSSLKSATSPRIELTLPKRPSKVGQRLQLICKATGGRPPPLLTLFKNETALMPSKHLASRKKAKAVSLVFHVRKAKAEDAGVYQCVATNLAGSTWSKNMTIKLPNEEKSHKTLCTNQNYCFHEGVCYIITRLAKKKVCECTHGYEGNRCAEKTNPLARMPDNKRRRLFKRTHGSHS